MAIEGGRASKMSAAIIINIKGSCFHEFCNERRNYGSQLRANRHDFK